MADTEIKINIKAIENITGRLAEIEGKIGSIADSKAMKNLGSSFASVAVTITALNQGIELLSKAYRAISAPIKEIIKAGAEQDRVESLLVATLKQKGIYTEKLAKSTIDYASALQKETTFGDETIISAQKLLLQYGVTANKLNEVTKATLDFAAATGTDLDTAASLIGKSIGTTTNALARYGVQMGKTTDASKRADSVIRGLSKMFGGSAAAEVDTYSGAQKQLANVYSDLYETLGLYIVRNEVVIKIIKTITDALIKATEVIIANKDAIIAIVTAIANTILGIITNLDRLAVVVVTFSTLFLAWATIPTIITAISIAMKTLIIEVSTGTVAFETLSGSVKLFSLSVTGAKIAMAGLSLGLTIILADLIDSGYTAKKAGKTWKDAWKGVANRIKEYMSNIKVYVLEAVKYVVEVLRDLFKTIADSKIGKFTFFDKFKEGADETIKKLDELIDKQEKLLKLSNEESKPKKKTISSSSGGGGGSNDETTDPTGQTTTAQQSDLFVQKITDSLKSVASGIAKGFEGASQAVVGLITTGLVAILGPIGSALSPLIDLFAQGKEAVQTAVTGFVDALPQTITTLTEGALQFVVSVLESIPSLIEGFIAEIPNLIASIISFIPDIIQSLVSTLTSPDYMTQITTAFQDAMIAATPDIIAAFADGVYQAGLDFLSGGNQSDKEKAQREYDKAKREYDRLSGKTKTKEEIAQENAVKLADAQKKLAEATANLASAQSGGSVWDTVKKTVGKNPIVQGASKVIDWVGSIFAAEGLDVPNNPAYKGDKFGPVMLDSGESVITGKTTDKLKQFLDNGGATTQPQNITINLVVGEKELATVIYSLNQRGFRTA